MRRRMIVIAAMAGAAAALAVGGVAWATSSGEALLSGNAKTKAVDAALEHVGGGTVLETEAGDDGAAYGVEIRLADGRVIEVALDGRFAVIGEEADDDSSGEESGEDDD